MVSPPVSLEGNVRRPAPASCETAHTDPKVQERLTEYALRISHWLDTREGER